MAKDTTGRLHVQVKTGGKRKLSSKLWLERQLNDPYVAKAKAAGYRSRAAFKLLEIDDKFRLLKSGMVYNFDPYLVFNNDANTRTGTAENFSISVSNIFKTVGYSGPVRVQRYQVDATTSNLKNFIDYANAHSGNTSGAPDPSLQLIEDYTATAVNGELQLHSSTAGSPAKPLGLGVALYRITLN